MTRLDALDHVKTEEEAASQKNCHRCGQAPCLRRGAYWLCLPHTVVCDIAIAASTRNILVLRDGAFWDYRTDKLMDVAEALLRVAGMWRPRSLTKQFEAAHAKAQTAQNAAPMREADYWRGQVDAFADVIQALRQAERDARDERHERESEKAP